MTAIPTDPDVASSTSGRVAGGARRWGAVFLAAVVVRLVYWATVLPNWTPASDASQYVELSRSLADGKGFGMVYPQMAHHPTAFRPPLLPFLLTPGAWLFGDALWPARLVSVLIGSLVVVLAGMLAARIGGRVAGLATAAVVALYPPLLANDTVTLTEPLALALMLGAILLVDERRWAGAGVVTGLLLLTRPNGYLVVAILAVWCWRTLGWRRAAAFAAIVALVFVPWLVRNRVQVGTWRPTTSDGFTMAAIYAQPGQDAGTFVDPAYSPAYSDFEHRMARFDESGWNRLLTEEALQGLRDDPGYVWLHVREAFRGYFELSPELNHYPEVADGRNMGVRSATRPVYVVVTLLGLAGLARRWRDPRVWVLAALTAQFVVLSLLLVPPPRLRAPFDLACCIGVGLLTAEVLAARARSPRPVPEVSPPSTLVG